VRHDRKTKYVELIECDWSQRRVPAAADDQAVHVVEHQSTVHFRGPDTETQRVHVSRENQKR